MRQKKLSAFSLMELSIVILIVGIIITGIVQSSRLFREFKLINAQNLTKSSPVLGIKGLSLWFDAVSDKVLTNTSGSTNISDGDFIKSWVEINPQMSPPLNFKTSTANSYPIYKQDGLNGLPTLSFDGVDDFLEVTSDQRINNLNSFTIFAVISVGSNANSATNNQGIITKLNGISTNGTSIGNPPYGLFVTTTGYLSIGIVGEDSVGIAIASSIVGITMPTALITDFSHDAKNYAQSSAFKLYLNGVAKVSRSGLSSIADLNTSLKIGQQKNGAPTRFATCYISEIIIFDRVLLNEERRSVQEYLSKKWNIKIL